MGGKLLGWRTVCAVEFAAYPRRVLLARQRDGMLPRFPIWDDVRTFDGKPWRGRVDVVSGGFPCTDISAAGKGAGIEGEHSGLWNEMARIIGEVRPRFVFVENSPLLVARGAALVIGDLAALGYDAQWCCVSASDCGAPHKRDRFWLVGVGDSGVHGFSAAEISNSAAQGSNDGEAGAQQASEPARPSEQRPELADPTEHGCRSRRARRLDTSDPREPKLSLSALADAKGEREQRLSEREPGQERSESGYSFNAQRSSETVGNSDSLNGRPGTGRNDGAETDDASRWPTEPDVGRVAHGVAARVDRLKAIGNGQVPRVAATAWRILTHNAQVTGRPTKTLETEN